MKKPVALQLYSVRDAMKADWRHTLQTLAKIGYRYVEHGLLPGLDATASAQAYAEYGLAPISTHTGFDKLQNDLDRQIADAKTLGLKRMGVAWYSPDKLATAADCVKFGEAMNAIGAKMRAEGIELFYHNHATELKYVEGKRIFDWILESSEPRNLSAQLDVYWSHMGGTPPQQFIYEYGKRITTLHIKDAKEIGQGPVDFTAVFAAAETIGTVDAYILEQEQYNFDPLECMRLNFSKMQAWGKL